MLIQKPSVRSTVNACYVHIKIALNVYESEKGGTGHLFCIYISEADRERGPLPVVLKVLLQQPLLFGIYMDLRSSVRLFR